MKVQYVGIGEIKVATTKDEQLKVMALGSCVAVIFYAYKLHVSAIAHVALPSSGSSNISTRPGYYADLAVQHLIDTFRNLGVEKNNELLIKLVGGAAIMDNGSVFNIGQRNVIAVKKHLWQNRLGALREDVGCNFSRSLTLNNLSGIVTISSPERGHWEI
ncbi:MAG: chemotaxis protein CheD [Calditrichaeota bacterium]|nr:chemotaxis protein CheD [Calditrichota bacterium]